MQVLCARGRPAALAVAAAAEAFGYVRVPQGAPRSVELARARQVAVLAVALGWRIGELFVERDPTQPLLAFTELLAAARLGRPVAVLLSGPDALGPSSAGASALRGMIERQIGVPVLVAPSPALIAAAVPGAVAGQRGGRGLQ
jgi:hypothetical protein